MADEIKVDIRALAQLARLDVTDEEVQKLEAEIPSILAFVDTIQHVDVSGVAQDTSLRNVLRPDEGAHEGDRYTESLLDAAPTRTGRHVAVKQVLSRKK